MISNLKVRNYQSLRDLDLDLGKFTVVVGPSSSGKSALVRALKLLVSNARGSSYVTHGQKVTAVTAELSAGKVTVTRGEGVGTYQLFEHGEGEPSGPEWGFERTFTKLGGAVPEEVTVLLGIEPGAELNVAGQFDRPYLLDSSPAEVARVLGKLTNVTVVLTAAREANRRHREASQLLKTRQDDLISLRTQARQFIGLKERLAAQSELETQLEELVKLEARKVRLRELLDLHEVANHVYLKASAAVPQPPGLEAVYLARDRSSRFQALLGAISGGSREAQSQAAEAASRGSEVEALLQARHEVLHEAGTCPTCYQSTRELQGA